MTRGLYLFEIVLILLFFNASCKSGKKKAELQFFYYPEKNVYYDPGKRRFWYSLNGTKSWDTFVNANFSDPATLGQKIVISTSNAEVYRDNQNHRRLYAGKLYNITLTDTATAMTTVPETTERAFTTQKKKPVATEKQFDNKRKSKTGIGKFINKIFGQHKR